MNKFEKILGKAAHFFGSQRHLVSIRDAFIAMLPLTMTGSIAVLLNVFIRDLPNEHGADLMAMGGEYIPSAGAQQFAEAGISLSGFNTFIVNIPEWLTPLIDINGIIWWASIAMMALVFSFSLGYNLIKNSDLDPLPGGIIGMAAFIVTIPQTLPIINHFTFNADTSKLIADGQATIEGSLMAQNLEPIEGLWGNLNSAYLGATGLFTAMIIVIIAMEIYRFLMKRNFTIKMPEGVPPAVSKAFTAIIPAIISLYIIATISWFFTTDFMGDIGNILLEQGMVGPAELFLGLEAAPINTIISKLIQAPLLEAGQGLPMVLGITFIQQTLWFVGMHGSNVLTPVYESIWGVAQLENAAMLPQIAEGVKTIDDLHKWGKGSFDIYAASGGAGMTLGLVISMLITARRPENKKLAKLTIGPGVFNINEPVIFGLPIVLNPLYMIPFIFVPMITVTIGYLFTVSGLAAPVVAVFPWVLPAGLNAFVATGGDLIATAVSLGCLLLSVVMWAPFVIFAERNANKEMKDGK